MVKNLKEELDATLEAVNSFRVRAWFEGEKEILECGKFTREEWEKILDFFIDDETERRKVLITLKKLKNATLAQLEQELGISNFNIRKHLRLLEYEGLVERSGKDTDGAETVYKPILKSELSRTPYEKIKFIVDEKLCVDCGACLSYCPTNAITIVDEAPVIDEDKCIGCGICNIVACPRTFLYLDLIRDHVKGEPSNLGEEPIAAYKNAFTAQTKKEEIKKVCQDGGIVTSLASYLFDHNLIDGVLAVKKTGENWITEPVVITNKEELLGTAGTKYVITPTLVGLEKAKKMGLKKIAVIGTPCQIQAVRKSQVFSDGFQELMGDVAYIIGIFCMENFAYQNMKKISEEYCKVNLENARKMDINKGQFSVHSKTGESTSVPIKEVTSLARDACHVCPDLTNELADISVGSIGSGPGWSTVLVRTEKGKELFQKAQEEGYLTSKPLDEAETGLPLLIKLAKGKRKRNLEKLDSKREEGKYATFF
ncbi:MAG: Coenzyme F420 hydrogenase/dehydrogenase, beta subunit C-terminal domain [Candidatus Jordarchaeum sp.]|uniref:Coenzyme F420 hydrogenase/dehydrogenase, beta subunit C-terminal domain n=1 Tax=Candidatus Jordarchaeum sp. TaxID=2823881 RepID=UPI00404AC530